jgi:hypothetical protein
MIETFLGSMAPLDFAQKSFVSGSELSSGFTYYSPYTFKPQSNKGPEYAYSVLPIT